MKKLLLCLGALLAVPACASNSTVDVLGQKCEQVAVGEQGDIIARCPASAELVKLQAGQPSAMFLSMGPSEEMLADKEHVYVNIVENDCKDGMTGYRVLVANPVMDGTAMYAVLVCE